MEGGIEFKGDMRELYLSNLWSHLASRVLLRLAEFKATNFIVLAENLQTIPWQTIIKPASTVAIRGNFTGVIYEL